MKYAYYNENEPFAAEWLRNLINKGLIADGEVDSRSIVDVRPDDVKGFTQVHFFAGIGGWSYAARLAGWPDDRPIWTGSCPCQPFSVAGNKKGQKDERHLWPVFFNLIRACRPNVVMGEQVAAAIGQSWLDGVLTDLEGIGYRGGRQLFRLVPSTPRTAEIASGLWPTPTASDNGPGTDMNNPRGIQQGNALATAALWSMWPTPSSRDGKGGYQGGRIRNGKLSNDTLDVTVQHTGQAQSGSKEPTESKGGLNPAFVCWLMGFPQEWESSAPMATPSSRKSRRK